MLKVPNPTGYKGIAIAKRKMDEPKTNEPIVFAYARIVQKRRPVVASEVVLGLAEDKDRVTRCLLVYLMLPLFPRRNASILLDWLFGDSVGPLRLSSDLVFTRDKCIVSPVIYKPQ